jgi:hypothetical protein
MMGKPTTAILVLLLAGCGYDAKVSPALYAHAEGLCANNSGLNLIYVDNSFFDLTDNMVFSYKIVCVNGANFYGNFKEEGRR